jgi:hypothetical protein
VLSTSEKIQKMRDDQKFDAPHNVAVRKRIKARRNNEEVEHLDENVIDNLKKIVSLHQAGPVKLDSGRMQVDVQTANVLLKVHGALNKVNQVKMAELMQKNRAGFTKMVDFSWKQVGFSRTIQSKV